MVRFSDIIKETDKKAPKDEPLEKADQEETFRLSDSLILKKQEDEKVPIDPPSHDITGRDVAAYYKKFITRAQEVRERVKGDKGISPSPILSDLHYIIDRGMVDSLYDYAMSAQGNYDDMIIHTLDVTFTCLKVGMGMKYDIKMLLRLGLAAFLENVGMYRIPDRVLKAKGKLGEREIRLIKNHPKMSRDILSRMGERYKWLAEVALQVHEREDGSGYPSGLEGGEILELASIIGLVDTYVAMIKNRPYREKFIQTDAIKSILGASKGKFPPRIVKFFLNQISLFPVNSYIRLNNGSIGRVISTDKNQPLRPTVEILFDSSGNKLRERQVIRLSENPLLYIDSSVGANDIH